MWEELTIPFLQRPSKGNPSWDVSILSLTLVPHSLLWRIDRRQNLPHWNRSRYPSSLRTAVQKVENPEESRCHPRNGTDSRLFLQCSLWREWEIELECHSWNLLLSMGLRPAASFRKLSRSGRFSKSSIPLLGHLLSISWRRSWRHSGWRHNVSIT